MRKILSAFIILGFVAAAMPANADGYYRHPPRHHHHGGGNNNGALVGGLIGGLVIGSILAGPRPGYVYEEQYYRDCYRVYRGRDYYGRKVFETVCE